MVYRTQMISEPAKRIKTLGSPGFDPAQEVVVEQKFSDFSQPASAARVDLTQPRKDRLEIEVETATEGLLVVADCYQPQIGVTLDGNETELFRANHAFRAVRVPAGRHSIVMQFSPNAFWQGLVVTMLAALITCVGLWKSGQVLAAFAPRPATTERRSTDSQPGG